MKLFGEEKEFNKDIKKMYFAGCISRLSGFSELALLSWHPESVLPLSLLSFMDYDCGRCGSTSYLSAKGENKKSPAG